MDIVRNVRRQIASFSLAAMIASLFVIGVAQAQTFPDVPTDHWAYSYVEDLVALGVVDGSMSEYRLADNVNRAEMAKLVVEAFELPIEEAATPTFDDVPAGQWFSNYVETAYAFGVVGGYNDTEGNPTGFFGPGDPVTREQAAKMIVLGAPLTENTLCGPSFGDVPLNSWSYAYVETLYVNSVVDGYDDDTFKPAQNINRAEIAKIVSNGMAPVLRPCGGFSVVSAEALTSTTVEACFTQEYDETSGLMVENYSVMDTNDDELAVTAVATSSDTMCVELTTDAQDSTKSYRLTVADVTGDAGDELVGDYADFDGYKIPSAGGLTVAIDGSTPESVNIPRNGANILYSVFAFTADDEEAVNVDQVILTRNGLGLPGDFKNLKLYVDGVQAGSEKTVNTSSNTATFNLSSSPIEVPADKTVLVEVRGDMDSAVDNSENQLCIAMSDDVNAMGDASEVEVTVGGEFAVCGETMTTTSAQVGTLSYTVTQPSVADINIGDTDVAMTKVKMDMATEDVEVNRVTFKQTGSADAEDFGNLALWVSGSMYTDNATWEGDYVTFDLEDAPLEIEKGNSKTVELRTDVVGGLASTGNFDIYRDWHIEGTGTVYGYGVNVVEVGGVTPTARNIVGGNVAFSLSSNNPVTGDVKKGASDHEFTRFNISTGGDGVTVRKLSVTVNGTTNANIDDVKIWTQNSSDEWYVVAGPNDITAALPLTVSFTDTFDVPAGVTQEFMITGDIANGAGAGEMYDIDLADVKVAANTELEYLSDGTPVNVATDVTGGMLNGNQMTVATPTLTVSLAATPGNKSYVRNTTEKDLAAFDMKASTADDLRVTSLVVTCVDTPEDIVTPNDGLDDDGDGVADEGDLVDNDVDGTADNGSAATDPVAGNCSTAFQTLKLYDKDGSTLTQLDSSARSMSASGTNDGKVTFSLNHTIDAGSSSRLLVRGDLSSGANADGYQFNIAATGDVSAEDTDSSVATVVGAATAARTIIVAANGAITDQGVTEASLQARLVPGSPETGDPSNEPVLKVKFTADDLEAWYVKKMQFDLDDFATGGWDNGPDGSGANDVSKVYISYVDHNGDPQVSDDSIIASGIGAGTVNFEGLNIYIPSGESQTVEVSLDMGDVTSGGAVAGDRIKLLFNGVAGYEAIGASSATLVTNTGVGTTSKELRLANSFPIVSSNDNVSTVMTTNSTLYSVNIEADAMDDIAIKQLCFDVVNGGGGSYALTTAKFYRDGESTDLQTAGEVTVTEAAGRCGATGMGVLVQWQDGVTGGEDTIAAGTSKTYVLKGDTAGAASGDKVTTTLIGDTVANVSTGVVATATPYTVGGNAEAFVWSDLSVSPHDSDEVTAPTSTDYLDGYLVKGLTEVVAHEVKYDT